MGSNGYNLTKPCPNCPFRRGKGYLHGERAQEIADSLQAGAEFTCHQTLNYDKCDDEGDPARTDKSAFCAGALIVLERMEQPNQMMRIMERLGAYDHRKLDMDADVFDDLDEFVEAHYG